MPKGQRKGPKRSPEIVFGGYLESAYSNYRHLVAKVRSMSRHRAIRTDGQLAERFNTFLDKMSQELFELKVKPGTQKGDTLTEFLTGA